MRHYTTFFVKHNNPGGFGKAAAPEKEGRTNTESCQIIEPQNKFFLSLLAMETQEKVMLSYHPPLKIRPFQFILFYVLRDITSLIISQALNISGTRKRSWEVGRVDGAFTCRRYGWNLALKSMSEKFFC